ncbi:MAG: hypothetical protein M3Z24_08205 [Chloroflexota bacterium]|nr:hypothetical protein [Chloroflexota bacterium]
MFICHFRIEVFELDAGVLRCEPPLDGGLVLVADVLPLGNSLLHLWDARCPFFQRLASQYR